MDALLRFMLTNAAAAGVIAALAFGVSRAVRRPALAHGLWLLALLKLVTPPLVSLPVLPGSPLWPSRSGPAAAFHPAARPEAGRRSDVAPAGQPAEATPGLAARRVPSPMKAAAADSAAAPRDPAPSPPLVGVALGWVLAAGALTVLLVGLTRFARFRRLLQHAGGAPHATAARADALAAALGLRRAPPIRMVAACVPPMLWPSPAGPVLFLPRDLWSDLTPEERDALLVHELAHVRRRDHWVRILELLASSAFWWYPVMWGARRALRRAEERCCDEWVLRVLPGSAKAYADGLLKSLTFLASASVPVPSFASGVSPLHELETRLKEILMSRPLPRLTLPLRSALLAAAALGLAVFPTHARDDHATAARPVIAAAPAAATPTAVAIAPEMPVAALPDVAAHAVAPTAAAPRSAATAATPAPAAPARAVTAATAMAAVRDAHEDAERALEAQRLAFDEERRALQRQELDLKRQALELNAKAEQDEARACAERFRAEGKTGEAEACARRAEVVAKRMALEARRVELEAERLELEAKVQSQEYLLRERVLRDELSRGARSGRDAVEVLNRSLKLERQRSEDMARKLADESRRLESEMRARTVGEASQELARAVRDELEALRAAIPDDPEARPRLESEIRRLEGALRALEADRPASPSPMPQR